MSARQDAGLAGEAEAARYLRARGYAIIASRWRCRMGELDLVARKGSALCFVEVKLRGASSRTLPREAVDRRKREKLRAAAMLFLAAHPQYAEDEMRFDVAEVYADPLGSLRVVYLPAAFE